jgi:hypothetical protein
MPNIDLSILNQRQTPAFFADTLANRPAPSFVGRIFISTDTLDLYRDTGTAWLLLSPSSTGTITGSGAAGQVTYFSGASSITGNNNLFWDSVNGHLGIGTNAPGTALQINHGQSQLIRLNQTTATNDTKIAFQNSGVALWRIGNSYNAGANDYAVFDVVSNLERFSIKTTGQTFIGAQTTTSGRLVVNNATGDNHIVVIGATAPSLRINNSGSGATKQIGIGLATTTNNFIQGAADRDMAIFNSSTTASPILFGIYDAGLSNTQEAARISAARNFLIGTSVDGGQRLQISGGARATGYYLDGMTAGAGALYWGSGTNRVTLANYNVGGSVEFEVNGGVQAATIVSSGNFLIGTASDSGGYGKLQIAGGMRLLADFNGKLEIGRFNSGTPNSYIKLGANSNSLRFTNNTDIADILEITNSGNLGLGINPSAWSSSYRAFQFGATGVLWGNATGSDWYLGNNELYNSSNQLVYLTNGRASEYYQFNGEHIFNTSNISGTANNPITYNRCLTISNNNNILIGGTIDDGTKLQVKGNVKFGAGNGNRAILDSNDSVVTLAPGGTADFDNFSGMLLVCNHNTGGFQIFVCGGGATASVFLLGGAMGTFTYNLGINGYTFTNNTASTYIYNLTAFRTRANA